MVKYSRGQHVKTWELTSGWRNEELDTLTYCYAARGLVGLDLDRREGDLARKEGPKTAPKMVNSAWLER